MMSAWLKEDNGKISREPQVVTKMQIYMLINLSLWKSFSQLISIPLLSFKGIIIITIMSLFQEDNIFGTNASLTYGPRLKR